MKRKWTQVAEAVFVAAVSAVVLMVMIYALPNCAPIKGYHPPTTANATANSTASYGQHADGGGAGGQHDSHGTGHARFVRSAPSSGHSQGDSSHDDSNASHGEHHDLYGFHGHGYVFQV